MRILGLLYAAVSYTLFLAVFVYTAGFLADVVVPRAIDAPAHGAAGATDVLVDLLLVAVFGLQHSVMARPAFKRRWTRVVSPAIERATYVLASTLAFVLLLAAWRPLPATLWDARGTPAGVALLAIYALGWIVLVGATFIIDHFELFGLAQAWRAWRERAAPPSAFTQRWLYRVVRHPIMLGFLLVFWPTPHMTAGHALFAAEMTAYLVVGTRLEERDMLAHFGAVYARYRERVPMLLPWTKRAPRD